MRQNGKNLEQYAQGREIQSLNGDGNEAKDLLKQVDTVTHFTLKL